jgi:FMN phosphatase YigB (HAD superfamily)
MEKIALFDFFGVVSSEPMFASSVLFPLLEQEMSYNLFKKKYLAYAFGVIEADEFWDGLSEMNRQKCTDAIDGMKLNAQVVSLIKEQYSITSCMIASEAPKEWIDRVLQSAGLMTEISGYFVSSEMKTTKPFKQFYRTVLDALPENAQYVFLDDSIENVEAAKRAGIESYVFPAQFDEFKKRLAS